MRRDESQPAAPPSYRFPVADDCFVGFEAPIRYSPSERRRWVQGVRRSNLADTAGNAADYFNEWLAETLDRGGTAFRVSLRERAPVDWEQRLREADERLADAPHARAARRAYLQEIMSWQSHMPPAVMADMAMEVRIGLPSGEWLTKEGPSPNWAELLVERIAQLAPHGTCLITRTGGRPALLVTMKRLEGEVNGLEVTWEEMSPQA